MISRESILSNCAKVAVAVEHIIADPSTQPEEAFKIEEILREHSHRIANLRVALQAFPNLSIAERKELSHA